MFAPGLSLPVRVGESKLMSFFAAFQRHACLDTLVSSALAPVLGASAFVGLAQRLGGNADAVHVLAYVVSGVGFPGAGILKKEGTDARGLDTAALWWCSAPARAPLWRLSPDPW